MNKEQETKFFEANCIEIDPSSKLNLITIMFTIDASIDPWKTKNHNPNQNISKYPETSPQFTNPYYIVAIGKRKICKNPKILPRIQLNNTIR